MRYSIGEFVFFAAVNAVGTLISFAAHRDVEVLQLTLVVGQFVNIAIFGFGSIHAKLDAIKRKIEGDS